jgi:hypothetical protein
MGARLGTLICLLTVLAWTPGASAAPRKSTLFRMFETVCLGHVGDTAGARAAATALGFAASKDGPGKSSRDWLEKKSGGVRYVAIISERTRSMGNDGPLSRTEECSVATSRPDAAVRPLVRAWAGFAPQSDDGVFAAYSYREVDGARTPFPADQNDRPMVGILREGPYTLLSVLHGKVWGRAGTALGISTMALVDPAPAAAPGS